MQLKQKTIAIPAGALTPAQLKSYYAQLVALCAKNGITVPGTDIAWDETNFIELYDNCLDDGQFCRIVRLVAA